MLAIERDVMIPAGGVRLEGDLALPHGPKGLVVFAHGSGSSRRSRRNRQVAAALQAQGVGTLLFDLLTEFEADERSNVFDIPLLASRLRAVGGWTRREAELKGLPLGYFGASTGAAAALVAATGEPEVSAIVSRGGRPDLAAAFLSLVRAPTLLIVGGADTEVLQLNEQALARLTCPKQLAIVPGATHLFEEPGALEEVERLAGEWFGRLLNSAR